MKTLILMLILSASIYAQTWALVAGQITDRQGRPVSSVTVYTGTLNCNYVEGSKTVTDWYGYYSASVNADCGFYVLPVGFSYTTRFYPNIYRRYPSLFTWGYEDYYNVNFLAIR